MGEYARDVWIESLQAISNRAALSFIRGFPPSRDPFSKAMLIVWARRRFWAGDPFP